MQRTIPATENSEPAMLYNFYEFQRSLLSPFSIWAEAGAKIFTEPESVLSRTPGAQRLAAGYELLHRLYKEYEKPDFKIDAVTAHDHTVPVVNLERMKLPFCRLLRMKRYSDEPRVISDLKDDPPVLVVAPMSGHHATLLRDTVRTLLADHKVYITDWVDARMVPAADGAFHLDDYVRYIETFIRHIGTQDLHIVAVCQPVVPVLAALSLMAARGEKLPASVTLMGGPVDARQSPTGVNNLAEKHSLSWFAANLVHRVPPHFPGAGRRVYPGFMQHAGFIAMNPKRHATSHWDFYRQLIAGDDEDAEAHRRFYDEYNAVLDLPGEYYLDTVRIVFQEYRLPEGTWVIDGERIDVGAIRDMALLTIEGELDDISGIGQTRAAHGLCTGIASDRKHHFEVKGAGHYGIFSGRRWREQVYPRLGEFIRQSRSVPATN